MLIVFLLYVPKRYFSDVNVWQLEESSRATLPFRRVCLWRHNHFTRETGHVAYHPPPCGWQAGHSGQIVWKTLWIWEKYRFVMQVCFIDFIFSLHLCLLLLWFIMLSYKCLLCPSFHHFVPSIKVCFLKSSYTIACIWLKFGRDVAPQV